MKKKLLIPLLAIFISAPALADQQNVVEQLASATKGKAIYKTYGFEEIEGLDMGITEYCENPYKNGRQILRTAIEDLGREDERIMITESLIVGVTPMCIMREGEDIETSIASGRNNCTEIPEQLNGMCEITLGEFLMIFLNDPTKGNK